MASFSTREHERPRDHDLSASWRRRSVKPHLAVQRPQPVGAQTHRGYLAPATPKLVLWSSSLILADNLIRASDHSRLPGERGSEAADRERHHGGRKSNEGHCIITAGISAGSRRGFDARDQNAARRDWIRGDLIERESGGRPNNGVPSYLGGDVYFGLIGRDRTSVLVHSDARCRRVRSLVLMTLVILFVAVAIAGKAETARHTRKRAIR